MTTLLFNYVVRLMHGFNMSIYKEYFEYLAIFYIIIFFTAAPCVAGDNTNLMSYETDTIMNTLSNNLTKTNDPPSKLLTDDSYFTGYFPSSRSLSDNFDRKYNLLPMSVDECFLDKAAITIGKYGDNITWSFVPLFNASGYNPIDAIRNFQVKCQFKF